MTAPGMAGTTARLAAYMAQTQERELPAAIVARAKHHLIDTLAAILSGSQLLPGQVAIAMIRTQGGTPEACVAGSDIVTSAINAAWANGMSAHADETDDHHTISKTHPGAAVVPAAMAIAERTNASGLAFLRAMVLGYDLNVRFAQALGLDLFDEIGHNTLCMSAVFGAATAAASVLGFDEQRMRYVLSYAAQQSAGIMTWKRDPDHIEKAFAFSGLPARDGVAAAVMVENGFTGVDDVLDGKTNFVGTFARRGDPDALLRGLGSDYEIARTNIKKWCVGGPIQAPLDGLSALLAGGLTHEEIVRVDVRVATSEAPTVDNSKMPDICLQHQLALLLVDGRITFASSHDVDRMNDPAVRAERAKINLLHDVAFEGELPRRPVHVVAVLRDGTSRTFEASEVRGTFGNPMDGEEIQVKALDLLVPVIGEEKALALYREVETLDRAPNLHGVVALLKGNPS